MRALCASQNRPLICVRYTHQKPPEAFSRVSAPFTKRRLRHPGPLSHSDDIREGFSYHVGGNREQENNEGFLKSEHPDTGAKKRKKKEQKLDSEYRITVLPGGYAQIFKSIHNFFTTFPTTKKPLISFSGVSPSFRPR